MASNRFGRVWAAASAMAVTAVVVALVPGSVAQAAPGVATFDPVSPIAISDSTGEKPQSKIWEHAGSWWAVLPTTSAAPSSGTWLWKLAPNGSWSSELKLSSATDTQADAKAVGDVAHILLYGASPELVSIEYNAGTGTYEPWSLRGSSTAVALPNSEIATIDIDSAGRLWLATENGTDLNVFYSDSPYGSFSGPVTLASGINGDDIGVVTAFGGNKVGVLWSNQNTERFGFRVHNDGADPTTWSADEVPASQSALNVGLGMADDHLNLAVASDGTLYAAVKTSYDTAGYPKIALLVRRPGGTWDDLYPIDEAGTRGIVLLNENENSVRVVYTSAEGYNNIVMKTSPTSSISFGGRQTLFTGGINDVTSTKENWSGKVLVLASSASSAQGGFIDVTAPANSPPVANDGNLSVDHDTAKNGTLHATDNDSDPLTFAIVDNGLKGTAEVTNASTGAFTYTPDPGETGSDSFTFKANDGTDDSNVATIDVTIAGPNLLVGHWRADEGSGTSLVDSSGSGNNATLFGSPTWVTGQVGQAISLNGTTQYATVPDDASLDITDAITIATWFKTSKTGTATQYLVKKGIISNTDGYELSLASSGLVFARFNQSATPANVYRVDSTTSYPLGGSAWMHAAVTYDGTTMRLYINGVLEDSTPGPASIATNNLALAIGAQSDGGTKFQGAMDDMRLYGRALSASEVYDLFSPPPGNTAPVASDGSLSVIEDMAAAGTLVASDDQSDPLTYSIVDNGAKGSAVVTNPSTGAYTYTPNLGATGSDSFTFQASDGLLDSNVATIHVSITSPFVGHWMADEGSGSTLLDSSGAGNDATRFGDITWVAGKIGQAAYFDGTGDYATVPNNPSLSMSDKITIAAWVRPGRAATQDMIKKATNGGISGFELSLASPTSPAGQKFFVRFNQAPSTDAYRVNSTSTYPLDTWSHVAATYDGSTIRLYVNGVLENSLASTFTIASNTLPLSFAGESTGSRAYQGALDDMRLYSRVLSASEIADLALVSPVNTAPVASNGDLFVFEGDTASGTLEATDAQGDPLTYSIVDSGSKGTAAVTNTSTGAFAYTPEPGETGADSFTFVANDGLLDSNLATVNVTITDPMVGHWKADEESGTTLFDASGAGNDATVFGDTTWIAGRIGNAVQFDGTGDYATVPDNPTVDNMRRSITMATWVYPEKVDTQYLIRKATFDAFDGYELSLSAGGTTGQVFFARFNQDSNANTYRLNSTTMYPINEWTHVAATYDGTDIRLYVNGVLNNTMAADVTIASNDLPLSIGAESDGFRALQGAMDDIRLYGRALSASEIQALATTNQTPVAVDGVLAVDEGVAKSGTLDASDPDSDPLTYAIVDDGLKGSAVVTDASTGAFTYTPAAGETGSDSFTFKVNDGTVDSNVATIEVTITADTTAPDVPTGVSASAVAGGVQVSWWPSGSSDVASYDVFRGQDGCVVALCAGVSPVNLSPIAHPTVTFTDTTVVPGTDYVYFVRATDDSGNPSDLSDAALVSYDCVSGEWLAEYYDGTKLAGPVVASQCVGSVDYNFSGSAPPAAPSVGANNYSIRFTQVAALAAGPYLFSATSDDGVRVKVDGEYVINDWTSHPATTFSGGATLTAGEHTIVVEYYQGGGSAKINATYTAGCGAGEWKAEYYDGTKLAGPVVASQCVGSVDYNFSGSAPPAAPSVGANNYSIRFTQVAALAAGPYLFSATSDDGVRVKVDGEYVINDWTSHPATTFSGGATLTAGEHTIVVEYYQGGGSAKINATYTAGCGAGEWKAEYYDGTKLAGPVVASQCVGSVDYNFSGSAPPAAPSVGANNYSIRFTQVAALAAGPYLFSATSDDGVRVKVDGEYVINDWTSHPATTFSGGATLTAGEHTIVVEYYQGGGSAKINATYTASP